MLKQLLITVFALALVTGCNAEKTDINSTSNDPAPGAPAPVRPTDPDPTLSAKPASETSQVKPAVPTAEQLAFKPSGTLTQPLPTSQKVSTTTRAVITMAKGGKIVLKFYPDDAPIAVSNFIYLAETGFYNGLNFHRVIGGFMAQGGCPLGTGTGDAGYKLKAEFNQNSHVPGTLAQARSGHPDSGGSQFYICLGSPSHLNGQYTVFGQTIEGQETVNAIQIGDVMKTVEIVY